MILIIILIVAAVKFRQIESDASDYGLLKQVSFIKLFIILLFYEK